MVSEKMSTALEVQRAVAIAAMSGNAGLIPVRTIAGGGSAPNAEFYDAKVKVLSEQIEHHVHQEERRSEESSPKPKRPISAETQTNPAFCAPVETTP